MTESEDLNQAIAADRGEKGELKSFSALAGLFGKSEQADKPAKKPDSKPSKAQDSQAPKPETEKKIPTETAAETSPANSTEAGSSVTPPPPAPSQASDKPENVEPAGGKVDEKEKFGEDFV